MILGLNTSHSGNISVRQDDMIFIKRSGAMLGCLSRDDIIETPISEVMPANVSIEYGIHRQIYLDTPHQAVLHCHPPHAIALSFGCSEIVPVDLEGNHHLGRVPVVDHDDETVRKVTEGMVAGNKTVMVRGHGVFAVGGHLEEALHYASALEMSSRILLLKSRQNEGR